jgi:hypothetical protein
MKHLEHTHDFVVFGAGLAGMCAAVTAARKGLSVALVQDRPVLGGNASKEIRVPPVGASNCNFAYSRETGLVEELYLNNLFRNPTWNFEGWNLEYESLVRNESNIDLFLNTAACDVTMNDAGDRIVSVKAYCAPGETWHEFTAPYYCDSTGDGVIGAQAGATFRTGIEARAEFGEDDCGEECSTDTMGNSIQMRARDAGRPIGFTKPAWVDRHVNAEDFGPYRPVCLDFFPNAGGFWWMEWGGALDTIHQSEDIRLEVQKIVLAVWDFLKNRSELAERLTTYELDWLGCVAGKRESRRFEGDHILTARDIESQARFDDAVAYGGWGIDHHPAGGFYDNEHPSTHRHLPGPHNIPLRSLYSKDVGNLFVAGRNLSASHYGLSNTRVMLTCAQLGEAVGMAAAHARQQGCSPRQLSNDVAALQQDLLRADHHIHGVAASIPHDIAGEATVTASSVFSADQPKPVWGTEPLTSDRMQLLPIVTPRVESVTLRLDATESTTLQYTFMQGPENGSTFPEEKLISGITRIDRGDDQWVELPLACDIARPGWHFLIVEANPLVRLHVVEAPPGQLRYYPRPEDPIRPNPHSRWTTRSLPIGQDRATDADGAEVLAPTWTKHAYDNKAMSCFLAFSYDHRVTPAQPVYGPEQIVNAASRPTNLPNLWVSRSSDFSAPEFVELAWEAPRNIDGVQILFDSALQFHFWQCWQGYPVNAIPSIVREYELTATLADGSKSVIASVENNVQRNCNHAAALENVTRVRLACLSTHGVDRAQVYALRVFGEGRA